MSDWTREKIDPIKLMESFGFPHDHVTYDLTLRKGDYSIIRQQIHDGTMIFTHDLLRQIVGPVAFKRSFWKNQEKEFDSAAGRVKYVVGPVKLSTVFGKVDLPIGHYPGQRERARMAVRCLPETVSGDG